MSLTVRTKLDLGFFSLLAIVLFIAFFTVRRLESLSEALDADLSRVLETHDLAQSISSDLYQEILAAQNYMVTRRAGAREAYEARSAGVLEKLDELLRKDLSPDARQELEEIRTGHSNLTVKVATAFGMVHQGSQEFALQETRELLSVSELLQDSMERFGKLETQNLGQVRGRIASSVERTRLILMGVALGLAVVGLLLLFWVVRSITAPLNALLAATELVSRGDLTKEVPAKGQDEFAQLARSFNAMGASLRALVRQVNEASDSVALSAAGLSATTEELNASAEEISATMGLISDGAETQSAKAHRAMEIMQALLEASRSMQRHVLSADEVGGRIREVAGTNVREIESAHGQLLEIQSAVETSGRLIGQFRENGQQIGDFVESINGIAAQTNLLALNAAIEAARAGEHGRGFAVVAEEVHKLAEESARAAESARRTIQQTRRNMEDAVAAMAATQAKVSGIEEVSTRTSGALAHIGDAVEEAARSTLAITEAAQRQSAQIEEMQRSIEEVSRTAESNVASATEVLAATEEQTASMQEMAAAAQDLSHHSDAMKLAIDAFLIDEREEPRPTADGERPQVERRDRARRPWSGVSPDGAPPDAARDDGASAAANGGRPLSRSAAAGGDTTNPAAEGSRV
jgi:methyl-accepting chemotaxis protein